MILTFIQVIEQYITSHFEIAIDDIIIGQVFIQTKFCVWGGEGTKYYELLYIFYVEIVISK